jgi:DNA-(apurinic or apyrimidinic site) lyase
LPPLESVGVEGGGSVTAESKQELVPSALADGDGARAEWLVTHLSQMPDRGWHQVTADEPEWKQMAPLLEQFGFGPFATIMVMCGLNDFALTERAEVGYWPPIRKALEGQRLSGPPDLVTLLDPFFREEREASLKLTRLKRFLLSRLAQRLWESEPSAVVEHFQLIWTRLAETMRQTPEKKTIAFGMKCLGIALLIAGRNDFAFGDIPVPVDYRIRKVTAALGFRASADHEIRGLWHHVLRELQKRGKPVTMVHLDSLLWQLGGVPPVRWEAFLDDLGAPALGAALMPPHLASAPSVPG